MQGTGYRGSYIDVCPFRNEELHHICLAVVRGVVQRLSSTLKGPVRIVSLERRDTTL